MPNHLALFTVLTQIENAHFIAGIPAQYQYRIVFHKDHNSEYVYDANTNEFTHLSAAIGVRFGIRDKRYTHMQSL